MPRQPHSEADFFHCPHCGARLAAEATFCRECGASQESGWGEEQWNEDLPGYGEDEDSEYDDFLRREFPEHAPPRSPEERSKRLLTVVVVALVCLAFLMWAFWQWGE